MSLLDADQEAPLCVMTQKAQFQADAMGMAVHNLTGVRWIAGRLSRPSFNQQAMWGTLGVTGEYTVYTFDGDIDNGMFLYRPDDNRLFRITGPRNKSYADGGLGSFWAYKVQEDTSQVIPSTFTDQLLPQPKLPPAGSAPAPPVLSVSGAAPSVTLTWNTALGVSYYNIWRGTASGGETYLGTVNGGTGTYTDTTGLANVTYYYIVYAQNQYGVKVSNEVSTATLLTSLLAYWTLNESSGNRADSSGNGNTMVQTGSVTGAAGFGNVGNVSVFPGNNADYLSSSLVLPNGDFTIAFWFNGILSQSTNGPGTYNAGGNGSGFIIDLGGHTFTWDIFPSFNLDTSGSVQWANTLTDNTWYFVAAYYQASTKNMGLSVNAAAYQISPGSQNPSGYTPSGSPLLLGTGSLQPGPMTGKMAGLGIWGRVLSPTGIANLFGGGNGVAVGSLGSLAG